jgi:1,4-alpha-glucan branching enzyme
MKKHLVIFGLFIVFVLSGCSPQHFVKKDPDSLTLYLRNPEAHRVQFAASVDHFTLHDARQDDRGIWEIKVPAGSELKYFYIVDGQVYVPECRFKEKDDFGAENCLYPL